MIEKYKKFLLVFVGLLFCASVFYAGGFIWANTLENGTDGFYFTKNFLLENTKDRPRIIFESGSNSHHSINSLMIEKEFKIFTLNLAENARYPLNAKLHRLAKNLTKDDIVILPLEYPYYYRNDDKMYNVNFSELVTYGKNYYNYLPINKKIFVLSKMNIKHSIKPFLNAYKYIMYKLFGGKFTFDMKANIRDIIASKERGDFNYTSWKQAGTNLADVDDNENLSCQGYIFQKERENPIEQIDRLIIIDYFKNNLEFIKKISNQTGAKFIFTYPALAGKNCYDFKNNKYEYFLKDIKEYVKNNGFLFIGNPFDSYFPNNMLNTYWHIDEKARDIRTKRLIEELKKTGLFNTNK